MRGSWNGKCFRSGSVADRTRGEARGQMSVPVAEMGSLTDRTHGDVLFGLICGPAGGGVYKAISGSGGCLYVPVILFYLFVLMP